MSEFFAITSFCDDIRREDSGKRLTVGEYASNLVVQELPHTLNQLYAVVRIGYPAEFDFQGFALRLTLPGGDALEKQLPPPPGRVKKENDSESTRRIRTAIIRFDNVELKEPGMIKAVVVLAGAEEEIKAGTLKVESLKSMRDGPSGTSAVTERELASAVMAFAHYARMQPKLSKREAASLARNLLVFGAHNLGGLIPENIPAYIWTSYNVCRVWFPVLMKEEQKIELDVQGGIEYNITNIDPYGFTVEFSADQKQTIEFAVVNPKF